MEVQILSLFRSTTYESWLSKLARVLYKEVYIPSTYPERTFRAVLNTSVNTLAFTEYLPPIGNYAHRRQSVSITHNILIHGFLLLHTTFLHLSCHSPHPHDCRITRTRESGSQGNHHSKIKVYPELTIGSSRQNCSERKVTPARRSKRPSPAANGCSHLHKSDSRLFSRGNSMSGLTYTRWPIRPQEKNCRWRDFTTPSNSSSKF